MDFYPARMFIYPGNLNIKVFGKPSCLSDVLPSVDIYVRNIMQQVLHASCAVFVSVPEGNYLSLLHCSRLYFLRFAGLKFKV